MCVVIDSSVTEMTLNDAIAQVKHTLVVANPEEGWNGLNFGKINFVMKVFQPFYPSCSSFEIAINIQDDISQPWPLGCGDTGIDGCAVRTNDFVDENSGHDQYGLNYPEWKIGRIFIDADDSFLHEDERHHVVNHEVGHIFGLQDGGPSNPNLPTPLPPFPTPTPFPVPLPTVTQNPWSCSPPSIMHSYGCTELDWPTDGDRFALEIHIPDAGSGGGGGGALIKAFF